MNDLSRSTGDWDEDGFHLTLQGDLCAPTSFRVRDIATARELLAAVSGLVDWVNEHDYEKAMYDAASDEERARVMGR